jgi:hypothetical protein
MIQVDAVRERIEARVPDLVGYMGTAGEFAALVEENQLPQRSPQGFVLPGRLTGGAADASNAIFRQEIHEIVGVVLTVTVHGDALGTAGVDEITPLLRDVINAVCGWGPDDAPGVFVLSSGELVGTKAGTIVYHLDFSLQDQLRIA